MSGTTYPKTLAELAVSTKPSPVDVLRAAADLTAEMRDYEYFEPMFAAAADDAESDLAWSPTPDDRSLDYAWIHYGGSCGPIGECACTLGAVIKAALELVLANEPLPTIHGMWTSDRRRTYDLSLPYEDRHFSTWHCVAVNGGVPYMISDSAGAPLQFVIDMFGPLIEADQAVGR